MTLIAAVKDGGAVYMAGDRRATANYYDAFSLKYPKIYKKSGWLVGSSGAGRYCAILEHVLDWSRFTDKLEGGQPDLGFMVAEVMPVIRSVLMENGAVKIQNSSEADDLSERLPGQALIAYASSLFWLEADLDLCEYQGEYQAIGSGSEIARGSLFTTRSLNTASVPDPDAKEVNAVDRLNLALYAAAHHNSGVGPNQNAIGGAAFRVAYDFLSTKDDDRLIPSRPIYAP